MNVVFEAREAGSRFAALENLGVLGSGVLGSDPDFSDSVPGFTEARCIHTAVRNPFVLLPCRGGRSVKVGTLLGSDPDFSDSVPGFTVRCAFMPPFDQFVLLPGCGGQKHQGEPREFPQ
jgi:hypothetical protein